MNEVRISGKIEKEPAVRYSAAGLCIATWTTVVEVEGKKSRVFVPCKAFGEVAQELESLGKVGTYIEVEGRCASGSYTARDGQKKFVFEIVAEKIDYSKGLAPSVQDAASAQIPMGFEEVAEDFPF